jgi:DNA invertase Pin-like site-specific DNA recombinase
MNIAIYTRKSIYSDKSDSIETQMELCKKYANDNYSVSTITIYSDEGFTGANTNRPDFSRLIDDIKDSKIDVLVCYKIDRISRNVLDFSKTFNILQENHVEFVSVKEQIDTSTPLGRAMMYICSVFAQMERETIAERIKDNMIELAKSGKWAGGNPPLGYKREKVLLNGKYHTILKPNEEELPLLNLIFDTFLKGYSLNGLETHFRKIGVKSNNGNFLSSTQLHQILRNPHYVTADLDIYDYFNQKGCIMATDKDKFDGKYGIVVYGRTSGGGKRTHTVNAPEEWYVSVGKHDPLMNSEKWLLVQNRFGLNMIDKTRKYDIGLLKGIIKCKCGYTMSVKHKVDKIYHKVYDSYYCKNRTRRGTEYCDMKMVSVSELDSTLMEILKKIKADKNLLSKYMKDNTEVISFRSKDAILKDISGTEKKIKNLTNTLQDNESSSAAKYIINEIERLDNQIASLNCELREVAIYEKELIIKKADIDTVYIEICEYINSFETLNYDQKVNFLKKIIKQCEWDGVNISLTF